MRVVVTTEARLTRTPDGAVWTAGGGPDHRFWTRYLTVFDQVRVAARLADVATRPPGTARVDGAGVEIWPLADYTGLRGYLRRYPDIQRGVRAAARDADAAILRMPSPIGASLASWLDRQRRPYGLEVVGDPYDVFRPGAVRHPLRPVLRPLTVASLRRRCRRAAGVAYVTEGALQRRYPAGPTAVTAVFSSVELGPEAFVPAPRGFRSVPESPRLVSVGSLSQMYKGVDALLVAIAKLAETGSPVRLVHVGDGRYRAWHEELAVRLGVADRVRFVGQVPAGEPVRRYLDEADAFVMPSRTEGLPCALIEAMARGLPAIGSAVGGIPELLPADALVPPDDSVALAAAIRRLLSEPEAMAVSSAVNLARARDYAAHHLAQRRSDFYAAIRSTRRTEAAKTAAAIGSEQP